MSRIGYKPIPVPSGVEVKMEPGKVTVKGPKGTETVSLPAGIKAKLEDSVVTLDREKDTKDLRAKHGLSGSLVSNAVHGVNEGFEKLLDVVGIGYRAEVRGRYLGLTLGHSHPIDFPIPEGMEIAVSRESRNISNYVATIKIMGPNRQKVGQVAADIRSLRPPDAYKGKGVRYADEIVRTKVGKKGA